MFFSFANLWGWSALISWSLLALGLTPLWLAAGLASGRKLPVTVREGIWIYGKVYLMLLAPAVKIRAAGSELTCEHAPAIIVANHQSWLDIYLMGTQNKKSVVLLVKAWPFKRLFFFGPLMRLAGYIATEGRELADIENDCRKAVSEGSSIICFPEGTRSNDGSLGRFHSGAFRLALALKLPLIPLCLHGSGKVMPKGSMVFRPGVIEAEIMPPLNMQKFTDMALPHRAMSRYVRDMFIDRLKELSQKPKGVST